MDSFTYKQRNKWKSITLAPKCSWFMPWVTNIFIIIIFESKIICVSFLVRELCGRILTRCSGFVVTTSVKWSTGHNCAISEVWKQSKHYVYVQYVSKVITCFMASSWDSLPCFTWSISLIRWLSLIVISLAFKSPADKG